MEYKRFNIFKDPIGMGITLAGAIVDGIFALTDGNYLYMGTGSSIVANSIAFGIGAFGHASEFNYVTHRIKSIHNRYGDEGLQRAIDKTHASSKLMRYIEDKSGFGKLRKRFLT